jgi:hypothetical protein
MDRFWDKVEKGGPDDCWEWTAATDRKGYGKFQAGSSRTTARIVTAHRKAWEITYGPIPRGEGHHGTCVLHTCDNPPCVNPAHLFLGTPADNVQDMMDKGRHVEVSLPGEANGNSKLTEEEVENVRALHPGFSYRFIADIFGVSASQIGNIVRQNQRQPKEI